MELQLTWDDTHMYSSTTGRKLSSHASVLTSDGDGWDGLWHLHVEYEQYIGYNVDITFDGQIMFKDIDIGATLNGAKLFAEKHLVRLLKERREDQKTEQKESPKSAYRTNPAWGSF